MIKVTVKHLGMIKKLSDRKTIALTFSKPQVTIRDVLAKLVEDYSGFENELSHPSLMITVNKQDIRQIKSFGTELADGDEIAFIPPIAGG